jgi:phospholipase/carboxylesterase
MHERDGTNALEHLVREPAGDPAGLLVLMHGRGVDERDLFPLLDELDPDRRLLGVAPRGPLSLPPSGAHWYAVREVGFPDPATFHPTFSALTGWIDALLDEHGLGHDRLVVGGFSQGSVMAYAAALARGRPSPAAIVAFSGFIPTVEGLDLDLESRAGLPVAIGHGTYDPIIEVSFGRDARDRLTAAGADVTYRESPMPHTIDPEFIEELRPWLANRIQD